MKSKDSLTVPVQKDKNFSCNFTCIRVCLHCFTGPMMPGQNAANPQQRVQPNMMRPPMSGPGMPSSMPSGIATSAPGSMSGPMPPSGPGGMPGRPGMPGQGGPGSGPISSPMQQPPKRIDPDQMPNPVCMPNKVIPFFFQ